MLAAGVADGVGSWADYPVPVDAGVYSRMLMAHAKAAAAVTAPSALAPLAVMRAAHSQTLVQARSGPDGFSGRLSRRHTEATRTLACPHAERGYHALQPSCRLWVACRCWGCVYQVYAGWW